MAVILLLAKANAAEVTIGQSVFTVPDGVTVERVAGPPLVDRPITASFDEQGRLYVADSSGSNDPVQKQLAEKPHRIVRLEDRDGDGQFDYSVVFADKMMFPQGTLWHDGSLFVAAPPSIWRLTDTDDDGTVDIELESGEEITGMDPDLLDVEGDDIGVGTEVGVNMEDVEWEEYSDDEDWDEEDWDEEEW